ncbi:hypothetical protein PZ897_14290 [Hoeflea sp. YIM 152468]|uniref:hypothetical protein n=1 Tax=Hoeflea sp. YIM 152468 TaxID=3031759 RepID=UPI0023DB0269|nr:hypothetical protein [Hoeflea sp. YIM 152468]MDF1609353.1 hypothetical protein [Hoeflea sp. YIM 152468]
MFVGFRLHTAMTRVCRTTSVVWRLCIDQPRNRRNRITALKDLMNSIPLEIVTEIDFALASLPQKQGRRRLQIYGLFSWVIWDETMSIRREVFGAAPDGHAVERMDKDQQRSVRPC